VSEPRIIPIERLDLAFTPVRWAFAEERRAAIDAHFAMRQRENPALWNGRVLLMHRYAIDRGVMRGHFLEADYASFAAWQDWGRPEARIFDCFAAAAILAADGAFLLGIMGPHTFNAGHIYFPSGTPDASDIADGKVDFEFSFRRELNEETGLNAGEFDSEPDWTVVIDNELIAVIKVLRSTLAAETLRARMLEHLAREAKPELADILIVRSAADFDPNMRRFVRAFLARRFTGG
jgi:8-oxo-dGTP pyrophosphatase MutT (NUDIX family)